jgi:hypothetical protein
VILVGGLRTTDTMAAMPIFSPSPVPSCASRHFPTRCSVSCNICLAHDGFDPLKCWRKSAADLAYHAYCRFWRDRAAH